MKPLVLVGETSSRANVERLQELGWGRMFVEKRPTPYPFEKWGFDNGAFLAYRRGEKFPELQYRKRPDIAAKVNSDPYIAIVPDIVAGGLRSLDFSNEWRLNLQAFRWPWFLAVQDGMEVAHVEQSIHLYDGLFLGGTDRFKATAYRWRSLAHTHRKRFHYGRASTPLKLLSAYRSGADSCDSAFPLWTAERMRIFARRWQGLEDCGNLLLNANG